jgi:hypothetical protein
MAAESVRTDLCEDYPYAETHEKLSGFAFQLVGAGACSLTRDAIMVKAPRSGYHS